MGFLVQCRSVIKNLTLSRYHFWPIYFFKTQRKTFLFFTIVRLFRKREFPTLGAFVFSFFLKGSRMFLSEDIKDIDKWIYCTKNSSNSYLKQKFKTRKMRSNMIYQQDTFVPSGTNNKRDVELEKQEKTSIMKWSTLHKTWFWSRYRKLSLLLYNNRKYVCVSL